MAPEPYYFCNLEIESVIGDKPDDHFALTDKPTHRITVTNNNGPECRVVVEVRSKAPSVSVAGGNTWRSEERTHGGRRSRGKRRWPMKRRCIWFSRALHSC